MPTKLGSKGAHLILRGLHLLLKPWEITLLWKILNVLLVIAASKQLKNMTTGQSIIWIVLALQ